MEAAKATAGNLITLPLSMASSGEESSEEEVQVIDESKMSEYEKQRFSRIAENKARLEALGISKSTKALLGSSPSSRKRNSGKEDDDYRPGEADGDEDDDDDDEDEDFLGNSTRVSTKTKKKASASKRKVSSKKNLSRSEEDSDDDLNKAIALSLQDSPVAGSSGTTPSKKKKNDQEAGGGRWKKKKPELTSRTQMTEDELILYFYQFDEAGKGFITLRDVAKMATVHDFTWIDEELQDMILCFDMDKDGKLSLDEFKKIVTRCRMLKES